MSEVQTIKTSCRACHGGCGAIVTVEDGRVTRVRPDPDSPVSRGRMCPKGLAAKDLLYDPNRLKYPMKRGGERGEGKWERISWDEAYDIVIANIEKVRREYGIQSLAVAQGTGRQHFFLTARFAHTLGTPNWFEPGQAQCHLPRVTACFLAYGHPLVVDYYSDVNPGCILVWGANPSVSGADGELQFCIGDAIRKGSRLIVVDPRRTELAKKADVWLQIRPGTDCALAMGMLHVIVKEKLYDKEFVENWTYGFEKLQERLKSYTPEYVSKVTWVPEADIVRAARIFAEAPTASLEWGCAIEHTPNCFDSVRAISILPGITGNFDIKGGFIEGVGTLPPCSLHLDKLDPATVAMRLGAKEAPLLAGADVNLPSAHIPNVFKAIETGQPYPIRSLLLFGNNGLIGIANSQKTYELLKKLDFLCCMDLFMTPTAEMCDLVLPAASWLEVDSLYAIPFISDHTVMAQRKITRLYECKADGEVFIELCERMGLDFGARTVQEIFDRQLKKVHSRHEQFRDVDFARLCDLGSIQVPMEYGQYLKNGRLHTPTGKMEIWSTVMEKLGLDPLPKFQEPPESPLSTPMLLEEYPLVLTTGGRSPFFFLSEGKQLPVVRRRHTFPRVEIHPETALKYEIKDGDWVFIETRRGRITQKALLTDGIDPRVVNCQYGWWYPEDESPEHGWRESNANILTSADPPYDSAVGTYQLRALLCRISKNEDTSIETRYAASHLFRENVR